MPSCPGQRGRLGKIWARPPPSGKGLPTRRRMLSGGPKWLIVRGSPGRGLQIAIFWVSACSVVRRAFLEPSRSGLPLPPPVRGRGQTAWSMAFLPVWPARKIWARPRPPPGKSCKSGLPPAPPCPCKKRSDSLVNGLPPRGPPRASSDAVGWPEMAHREGVLRTRPPNRDFLGFCVFCGPEGVSRA